VVGGGEAGAADEDLVKASGVDEDIAELSEGEDTGGLALAGAAGEGLDIAPEPAVEDAGGQVAGREAGQGRQGKALPGRGGGVARVE